MTPPEFGNVAELRPLNGSKTHPLSPHALLVLAALAVRPQPTNEINPGVVNRLQREGAIEIVSLPSPYKGQVGRTTNHARITAVGHAVFAQAKDRRAPGRRP